MEESKYTPGPWNMCLSDDGISFSDISAESWSSFARVVIQMDKNDEDHPNARLIAAAPELLAALKRSAQEHLDMASLLDAWARESVEGSARLRSQCRKYAADALTAIAKAEGR